MSTVSKGSGAENFVAKHLEAKGYVVASCRHRKGGGDLLAVHPAGPVLLVEVKGCKDQLWARFPRSQRQEMRDTPIPAVGERTLAHVTGSGKNRKIAWYAESEWPGAESKLNPS